MKKTPRVILKVIFGLLAGLILLVVFAIGVVWFEPQWVLTSSRLSSFTGLPLGIVFEKPDWRERKIKVSMAPGCHPLPESLGRNSVACSEKGDLVFSIRLHRKTIVQLTTIDRVDIHLTKVDLGEAEKKSAAPADAAPPGPPGWTKYLSDHFAWGEISVEIDHLHRAGSEMILRGSLREDSEGEPTMREEALRAPPLRIDVGVESPTFSATGRGKLRHRADHLEFSEFTARYRGVGKTPMVVDGVLSGKFDLKTQALDTDFSAEWAQPFSGARRLSAADGKFRLNAEGMFAKSEIRLGIDGKTPLGNFPELTASVEAKMKKTGAGGKTAIDVKLGIADYAYGGLHAYSDLELRIMPHPEATAYEVKKGKLRVELASFAKLVKSLERTAWSIPAPFAVLDGTVSLHSEAIENDPKGTKLPFTLKSDLASPEQALKLKARAIVTLAPRSLSPAGISVAVNLDQITLRLPDYDPIAPTPAFRRDPRIVRYEDGKTAPKKAEKKTPPGKAPTVVAAHVVKEASLPLEISVEGGPRSLKFLNRLLDPALELEPKLHLDPMTGLLMGDIHLSTVVDIEYLNRRVKLEAMYFDFDPTFSFGSIVSMERAGYRISAEVRSYQGKTQIKLSSEPPLSDDEIVSLIIYGMPRNSITSEQTRSVGSAQSAMSSQALGVFSFWAFASTPIESVLYDPATETYSAVVRLPGGIVASIGSNWDNDRQVSLSRSLGKNWAVSTELIKDSEGVDRGGTLLRWRKSY